MTRKEFINGIRGSDVYRFEDIPKEYLDKEVLMEWLLSEGGALSEVPKHLVDDEIRKQAVGATHEAMDVHHYPLKSISLDETPCYEELALLALGQCEWNMQHVDPALHNEAFFLKALEVNPQSMMHFFSGWGSVPKIEWTEAMIDLAVSKSLDYLKHFDPSQVKVESLKKLIREGGYTVIRLAQAGLLDVIGEMMGEGYWPEKVQKPSSLEDALDALQDRTLLPFYRVYYTAFVRHHPIESVLPLMKSPKMQALMLEVYRDDELIPHLRTGLLKGAPRVRGKLLENGLGL
jgi:hypothetical protein